MRSLDGVPTPPDAMVELAGIGLGIGDELGDRLGRDRWIDQHDVGHTGDASNRRDVAAEIETKLFVQRSTDHVCRSDEEERIAVRERAHDVDAGHRLKQLALQMGGGSDSVCEALGVSRGGFYAWLTRSRSQRSRSDEELGAKVRTSFVASDRTYGARRVWKDLLAEGLSCGLHRIERLMRLQALKARPRRRRLPPDLGERQATAVAANVLDRTFDASAPNRKWIADFTYVWTAEGWLYVAAVIDLFSRRVVGWSMRAAMKAQVVTDALAMGVWLRGKPDSLLHHSDRGSQYTSEQFQKLMADHGVVCSMSRSGNVWDNAPMESFFSSVETERTGRKTYRTRDEARADVFDYIERFYNPKRRHSTIGYLSPMEFESQAGLA